MPALAAIRVVPVDDALRPKLLGLHVLPAQREWVGAIADLLADVAVCPGSEAMAILHADRPVGCYRIEPTSRSVTGHDLELPCHHAGNVGIGVTAPSAALQLKAGTATAGTAPLKLTSGALLGTAEAGAIEYDGDNLYYTNSSNARQTLATVGGAQTFSGDQTFSGAVNVSNGTSSSSASTGALVTGGGVPELPAELSGGAWVQPTIWTGLPETAAVVREEIFGPCCHIRPFDSEDEVVALANDTEYGLSTTIWTTNLSRAHRMAERIKVGITWINSWFLRDLRTPFGGSKHSGIGLEGGVHSLEFYTETRNVCVKL